MHIATNSMSSFIAHAHKSELAGTTQSTIMFYEKYISTPLRSPSYHGILSQALPCCLQPSAKLYVLANANKRDKHLKTCSSESLRTLRNKFANFRGRVVPRRVCAMLVRRSGHANDAPPKKNRTLEPLTETNFQKRLLTRCLPGF